MKEEGKGTFVVRVEYTQNNSWQGSITWTERNQTEHFRSALELLQLMDNAMGGCARAQDVHILTEEPAAGSRIRS